MHVRTLVTAAALAVIVVSTGCRRPETESSSTQTTGASTTNTQGRGVEPSPASPANPAVGQGRTDQVGTPQGGAAALSDSDQKFLEKAVEGSLMEIGAARHVQEVGMNAEVKSFASQLYADHTKAHQELQQLASSKGITLPTQMGHKDDDLKDMTKLAGSKLDKEYAKEMVEDHEKDVKEFRTAAKDVQDPELRLWAQKRVPILEGHLTKAKELKTKIK